MITISREGTKVKINVDSGLVPPNCWYSVRMEMGTEQIAELLANHLRSKMHNALEGIHKGAYDQGYKDGRGKKTRRSFHRFGWYIPNKEA